MSAVTSAALVRLPSGRIIGAEVNDRGNLVPHGYSCICARCEPELEAKRQRVRDAAQDLLESLQKAVQCLELYCDHPEAEVIVRNSRTAIAKAMS